MMMNSKHIKLTQFENLFVQHIIHSFEARVYRAPRSGHFSLLPPRAAEIQYMYGEMRR
jgi:hypothetical protein